MSGTYKLTGDFALSHHTDPLHDGRIVRDINLTPTDKRLPDIAVCRVFTSRADAEIILAALMRREMSAFASVSTLKGTT